LTTTDDTLALLAELNQQVPPIPAFALILQDNLRDRVNVIRLGVKGVFQKPVAPTQLLEMVSQVLQSTSTNDARILIVDDDDHILQLLHRSLSNWGLDVFTLDNSIGFLDTLRTVSPHLLILDIEMPEINGLELCQVVRSDPNWSGLSVLFLTAHTDAETIRQVFSVGADDYLSKPIMEPELLARVVNRLARTRILRNLAETDPLTGIANRRKSTQDLNRFINLAHRQGQPLCLAILDLDHFKTINDQYGHAMGDYVLHHLGELLRLSFRDEDVVARWGGEEFVVGMYSSTQSEAVERLTQFLATLQQQIFITVDQRQFTVTFSAGVSAYPTHGTDLPTLYQAADKALYQAKTSGRKQVVPASNNAEG
jgi:diguanylate cyclase (GGDEF)-like protein